MDLNHQQKTNFIVHFHKSAQVLCALKPGRNTDFDQQNVSDPNIQMIDQTPKNRMMDLPSIALPIELPRHKKTMNCNENNLAQDAHICQFIVLAHK